VASRAARLFPAEKYLKIPNGLAQGGQTAMFNPILPKEQVKAMNIGGFWPAKLADYLYR
jgi:hypothetical protein